MQIKITENQQLVKLGKEASKGSGLAVRSTKSAKSNTQKGAASDKK